MCQLKCERERYCMLVKLYTQMFESPEHLQVMIDG